jgi:hypothetical protein
MGAMGGASRGAVMGTMGEVSRGSGDGCYGGGITWER